MNFFYSDRQDEKTLNFKPSYINLEQILNLLKQSVRFQKNQLITPFTQSPKVSSSFSNSYNLSGPQMQFGQDSEDFNSLFQYSFDRTHLSPHSRDYNGIKKRGSPQHVEETRREYLNSRGFRSEIGAPKGNLDLRLSYLLDEVDFKLNDNLNSGAPIGNFEEKRSSGLRSSGTPGLIKSSPCRSKTRQYGYKYKKKRAFSKKQFIKLNHSSVYYLTRYAYPFKYSIFRHFFKRPKVALAFNRYSEHKIIREGPLTFERSPYNFFKAGDPISDRAPGGYSQLSPKKLSGWSAKTKVLQITHLNFSRPTETVSFRGTKKVPPKLYTLYTGQKEFYQEFFKVYTNFITNEMLFNFFRTRKTPSYNKEGAPIVDFFTDPEMCFLRPRFSHGIKDSGEKSRLKKPSGAHDLRPGSPDRRSASLNPPPLPNLGSGLPQDSDFSFFKSFRGPLSKIGLLKPFNSLQFSIIKHKIEFMRDSVQIAGARSLGSSDKNM